MKFEYAFNSHYKAQPLTRNLQHLQGLRDQPDGQIKCDPPSAAGPLFLRLFSLQQQQPQNAGSSSLQQLTWLALRWQFGRKEMQGPQDHTTSKWIKHHAPRCTWKTCSSKSTKINSCKYNWEKLTLPFTEVFFFPDSVGQNWLCPKQTKATAHLIC